MKIQVIPISERLEAIERVAWKRHTRIFDALMSTRTVPLHKAIECADKHVLKYLDHIMGKLKADNASKNTIAYVQGLIAGYSLKLQGKN
jgi:hypothetical protein